ncbi:hypothetical protein [Jiella pelagia]|uniref:J domain-containing protein n=1 Tax=Jiella pelagia TaxID=2986949 RepID=A0ABY7C3D8_9HYPH|nr:hypothetical protein [Jiella pelagia]WAP70241.1 hypothetical protein OH818_09130 [Jiella pelagia]
MESVAARHQDKGWRTVLGRASSGMMSAIGMRRGPRIAESVERTAAARAAYEEALEAEELAAFDEPEAAKATDRASPPRPEKSAEPARGERPSEPRQSSPERPPTPSSRAPQPPRSAGTRGAGNGSAAEAGAAYARTVKDGPQPGAPSVDPYDVAMELNILALRSVKDLLEARRAFARTNHPDRVAIGFRAEATTRMQIANRLVDDAVARMSGQASR